MINLVLIVVFAVLIGGGFIARFIRQRAKHRKPAHAVTVTVDDDHFTVDDGKTCVSVPWSDITRVTVITTDQGPWLDDLFYHIVYNGGDVTLPSEAQGMNDFVARLATLSGFDAGAFGRAIGSTQKGTFTVILHTEEPVT